MSTEDNPFDGVAAGLEAADEQLRDTFGWYTVAKKEFRDAIRSRGLWLLSLIFVVFFILPVAGALYLGLNLNITAGDQQLGMQVLISSLYLNMVTFLLPVVAIFVGYAAITKERTSGSLKLLLSLPHSRKDVILGKVLGRCLVVGVPLLFAYGVAALFFVASSVTLQPELYGLFALFTFGFAIVFVAITVSISGAFSTSMRSGIASFFAYFYLTFGWNSLANGVGQIMANQLGIGGSIRWHAVLILKLLNPSQAYKTLTNSMLGEGANAARSARFSMFSQQPSAMESICTQVLDGTPQIQEGLFGETVVCGGQGSLPIYYSDAAVFVAMVVWVGIAAAISYYTFNLADL